MVTQQKKIHNVRYSRLIWQSHYILVYINTSTQHKYIYIHVYTYIMYIYGKIYSASKINYIMYEQQKNPNWHAEFKIKTRRLKKLGISSLHVQKANLYNGVVILIVSVTNMHVIYNKEAQFDDIYITGYTQLVFIPYSILTHCRLHRLKNCSFHQYLLTIINQSDYISETKTEVSAMSVKSSLIICICQLIKWIYGIYISSRFPFIHVIPSHTYKSLCIDIEISFIFYKIHVK